MRWTMDPDPECAEEGRDRLVVSLTVFVGRVKPIVRIRFFLVRGRVRSWEVGSTMLSVLSVVRVKARRPVLVGLLQVLAW